MEAEEWAGQGVAWGDGERAVADQEGQPEVEEAGMAEEDATVPRPVGAETGAEDAAAGDSLVRLG